jgi:hypothetical protein
LNGLDGSRFDGALINGNRTAGKPNRLPNDATELEICQPLKSNTSQDKKFAF